jgi:cellulose synthase/poly-beta-1,6-N-acetylglucosamine synthase-like glycosyltransferase
MIAKSTVIPAKPPTVSVIVPIYNGERDLPGLIDCLRHQTYPADRVEYILVDNGSCDRTPTILAQTSNPAVSPPFKCLQETALQSAYAARNTGIRNATGDILAFTDADCYPQPDWLEKLVQGFQEPQVGLVAGAITALPGTTWLEHYAERKQLLSQSDTLAHPFCPYGQTANLAIRTQALTQIGLFRPRLTTGGDADICWRLQREGGWRLRFEPTAEVRHHHRTNLRDLYSQWARYGRSNRYLHQLYGVPLSRALTAQETSYTLMRWLLKELPLTVYDCLRGKGQMLDAAITPLSLYCGYARSQGQETASLPAGAEQIERFDGSYPPALESSAYS